MSASPSSWPNVSGSCCRSRPTSCSTSAPLTKTIAKQDISLGLVILARNPAQSLRLEHGLMKRLRPGPGVAILRCRRIYQVLALDAQPAECLGRKVDECQVPGGTNDRVLQTIESLLLESLQASRVAHVMECRLHHRAVERAAGVEGRDYRSCGSGDRAESSIAAPSGVVLSRTEPSLVYPVQQGASGKDETGYVECGRWLIRFALISHAKSPTLPPGRLRAHGPGQCAADPAGAWRPASCFRT